MNEPDLTQKAPQISIEATDADGRPLDCVVHYFPPYKPPKHFSWSYEDGATPPCYMIMDDDEEPASTVVDGDLICFYVPKTEANTAIIEQVVDLMRKLADIYQPITESIKNPTPELESTPRNDAR